MSERPKLFTSTNRTTPSASALPYGRRRFLLSVGERRFYTALHEAVGGRFGVSIKTRLADLVRCPAHLWDTPHGWKLSQKHVDFVLYDLATTAIVLAVELDDRSHDRPERRARDAFVDEALATAGVLLLRAKASRDYHPLGIRRYLERVVGVPGGRSARRPFAKSA